MSALRGSEARTHRFEPQESRVIRSLKRSGTCWFLILTLAGFGLTACAAQNIEDDEILTEKSDTEWDPLKWEPTVKISPAELSEEEKLEQHIAWISRNYPDQYEENPDIEVGPWLKSQSEQSQLLATCLQDFGFAAHAHPGGGTRFDPAVPEAQSEALDEAFYTCESRFPLDRQYFVDFTEEHDGLLYDYWDQYYIPCMEAHGHSVSRDAQPSRETFIATIGTSEYSSWWPAEVFDLLPLEQQEAIADACPPYPPDEHLYGT